MALTELFRCRACGLHFETIVHNGVAIGLTRDDDAVGCLCGSTDGERLVGAPRRREDIDHDNSFPRYDLGLGMWLESEEHRRRVCKERGLVPLDHVPSDHPASFKEARRKFNEEADRGEAYMRRLEDDPDFAGYRRARDEGRLGQGAMLRGKQ